MQTETILPWQESIWESLLRRKNQNRLPHALLFLGADGIGKKEFAHLFASYLFCQSPQNNRACGRCKACYLKNAKSHPDFRWIEPEEDAQFIKIDQIREIVSFVNGTAMLGGYRVIVINPASAMNVYAANALLKTLEEPTANTLLILICHQGLRLPATISSRCQKIIFPKPERDMALAWLNAQVSGDSDIETLSLALNLTEGAPLRARDFLANNVFSLRRDLYDGMVQLSFRQADPLQFATQWEDKDIKIILNLLFIWLRDLLRCKLTEFQVELINHDYRSAMSKIISKLTAESLLQYVDFIQKVYAQILNSLNVNRSLLLKEIFIRWVKLC